MSSNKIKINLEGEMKDIDQIYLDYKDSLYRFVYRYSINSEFSIDIVQDTFEKFLKNKHHFDPRKGDLKSYLFRITYNTMMTKLKRKQRLKKLLPFLYMDPLPMQRIDEKISVQHALQTLPEEQRLVVLLVYYHDLTQKEVANILGIPLGTVKSRLHHAMIKLKKTLEGTHVGKEI